MENAIAPVMTRTRIDWNTRFRMNGNIAGAFLRQSARCLRVELTEFEKSTGAKNVSPARQKRAARTRQAARIGLLHGEVFDAWLIFWINLDADAFAHAPVQHLVVDRDVELFVLNNTPDRSDIRVTCG